MTFTASPKPRRFYLLWSDWTWWAWALTATLLVFGLLGYPCAFGGAAMVLTAVQFLILLFRERSVAAFPVQLRLAYLALLALCYLPPLRWLYWLPTVGTFALVLCGYCLMARLLSLLPWNRREPFSLELLGRTFLSRPDLSRVSPGPHAGCAGGLCTLDAQVPPQA